MSFIRILASFSLAIITITCGLWLKKNIFDDQKTKIVSTAPTIEEIETLSELVTNRVYVADILKGSNKDYEGVWAVNGDALISVDLANAVISNQNDIEKTVTITLPMPEVISARVDHNRTIHGGIKGVRFALLRNPKNRESMLDEVMKEAQAVVEKAANKPELIENAQKQAQASLQHLYHKMGWNVSVKWQKHTDLAK